MNNDPILKRIWRVQDKLARKAGYDPGTYADNAGKTVEKIEKRYGFKFKYADIPQIPPQSLRIAETPTEYKVKRRHL